MFLLAEYIKQKEEEEKVEVKKTTTTSTTTNNIRYNTRLIDLYALFTYTLEYILMFEFVVCSC